MPVYKGASRQHEIAATRRRKDTRLFGQKWTDFFSHPDGAVLGLALLPILGLATIKMPFAGELLLLFGYFFANAYIKNGKRAFDFPYRVPILANAFDGSTVGGKSIGKGVTMLGNDNETKEQIYAGDSDLRTHMLVLGTTGSGKTEFLLGLVFNAMAQNTGFIYVDGKGDPKLQKEIFRMARYVGREDDLLIINFITSGRDFIDKQVDKVTNNMNMMGNTSSGMLIEVIVSLMDDSGGSGDMWKGRAISFVAAITRPLVYLRDKGFINLSPEKYLEHFELNVLEELVWEHNGKYGEMFDVIVAPLRAYLVTLPGYQLTKKKKQETKTLEQHGFIVMQLTRIFNDLTFNYGHIFKTKVGDVDFFDVVINRRFLVVLLPALERAPDSMRMLGKMIVGSIKQMMAGCLGNRVEGVVREIIDSRPTNATFPFYVILDEYGYYAVIGFAVAPAQARSLGFSVTFAAQDFSSLKKSSAEEADATWENTNIRAVGRITSGQRSETWERIQGAAGESDEARLSGFERKSGAASDIYRQQDNVSIERRSRIDYDDLAMQENGEFTFLIGKKEKGGRTGGVRVIRGMGFYTAGKAPQAMRINDFLPVESPEPAELPQNRKAVEALVRSIIDGSLKDTLKRSIKADPVLTGMHRALEKNYAGSRLKLESRSDMCFAVMGLLLSNQTVGIAETDAPVAGDVASAVEKATASSVEEKLMQTAINSALLETASKVIAESEAIAAAMEQGGVTPKSTDASRGDRNHPGYAGAIKAGEAGADEEVRISTTVFTTNITVTDTDQASFRDFALPILREHLYMVDESANPDEIDWRAELSVAERDKMIEMEIVSGKRYATMEEKWAAEERIDSLRSEMSKATSYIEPPAPDPISLSEARSKVEAMSRQCETIIKRSLSEK